MGVVLEVEALKRPLGFPCQLQHLWPICVEGSRISSHRREIPAPQDAPQRCTGVKSGDDLVPEPKTRISPLESFMIKCRWQRFL